MSASRAARSRHARTRAAHQERGMRPLDRRGAHVEVVHTVVAPEERAGTVAPALLEHGDRLGESIHPHARLVHRHPGTLVVGAHPPCADADLETSFAEHVERRRLLCEDDRVAVVVAERERADAQRVGRVRRRRDRGDRSVAADEVITNVQRRIAEGFDAWARSRHWHTLSNVMPPGPTPNRNGRWFTASVERRSPAGRSRCSCRRGRRACTGRPLDTSARSGRSRRG